MIKKWVARNISFIKRLQEENTMLAAAGCSHTYKYAVNDLAIAITLLKLNITECLVRQFVKIDVDIKQ